MTFQCPCCGADRDPEADPCHRLACGNCGAVIGDVELEQNVFENSGVGRQRHVLRNDYDQGQRQGTQKLREAVATFRQPASVEALASGLLQEHGSTFKDLCIPGGMATVAKLAVFVASRTSDNPITWSQLKKHGVRHTDAILEMVFRMSKAAGIPSVPKAASDIRYAWMRTIAAAAQTDGSADTFADPEALADAANKFYRLARELVFEDYEEAFSVPMKQLIAQAAFSVAAAVKHPLPESVVKEAAEKAGVTFPQYLSAYTRVKTKCRTLIKQTALRYPWVKKGRHVEQDAFACIEVLREEDATWDDDEE